MFKLHIIASRGRGIPLNPYEDYIPIDVTTYLCEDAYVSDALAGEIEKWKPAIPVMIDAGTGRGKNTFVYDTVLPRAEAHGKNVLYLCNRVALATQVKIDVMEAIKSEKKDYFQPAGLRVEEDFGFVRVLTYHRLPAFLNDPVNKEWIANLMYVIADEVHYGTKDALFNPFTTLQIELITKKFRHAIRIYTTATSYSVIKPIFMMEQKAYKGKDVPIPPWEEEQWCMKRYYFPRDYQHLDLNFFHSLKEIKELIGPERKEGDEGFERWLIFVDSKESGRAFAEELGSQATYLDSSSKGTDDWDSLLFKQKFDTQVLIATQVLDCGVNIKDPHLKNICICSDDRTSIEQMIGRKRIMDKKEKVKLYIRHLSPQALAAREANYQKAMDYYLRLVEIKANNDFEAEGKLMEELWLEPDNFFRCLFRTQNRRLIPCDLGRYAVGRRLFFYHSMEDPKVDFPKMVKQWLGMPEEETALDILNAYCQEMEGTRLDEVNMAELRSYLWDALVCMNKMQPHDNERYKGFGYNVINNRLRTLNCNYQLSKDCVLEVYNHQG